MSTQDQGTVFLNDLKNFLSFLQNLWGILAGISVLFPLANVFIKILPIGDLREGTGPFGFFPAEAITAISTVVSLFVILWTYSLRYQFRISKKSGRIRRQAWISFGIGILAALLFLSWMFLVGQAHLYGEYQDELGYQVRVLFGDILLLIAYASTFVLITRGFILLAMIEYFGKETK